MSDEFFGPPPPAPPEPSEPRDHRVPPWVAPPENEVGVALAEHVELVRAEDVAIAIVGFTVFTTGLWFTLSVRNRQLLPRKPSRFPVHPLEQPGGLRFGMQFADGTKATTIRRLQPGETPSPPQLTPRGFQGLGGHGMNGEMWLWPLPPTGPLAFVVEWPEQGIALTRREIDAQQILDAAARVERLWPDERPLPSGPWTHAFG